MRNLCRRMLKMRSMLPCSSKYELVRRLSEKADKMDPSAELDAETLNSIKAAIASRKRGMKNKELTLPTMYLLNRATAKELASLVVANRSSKLSHMLEINSGLGYLTEELLEAGVRSIQMFEGTAAFWPHLEELVKKYPKRLTLGKKHFGDICHLNYIDWLNGTEKFGDYFARIEKKKWTDKSVIEIVCAISNLSFINYLLANFIQDSFLWKYRRVTLYATVPPSLWKHITSTNVHKDIYTARIIFFQTFFQCSNLGQVSASSFYPKIKKKLFAYKKHRNEMQALDQRQLYFVKLEARADIFDERFTKSDVKMYYYFLHHHLKSRKNRLIPALENWMPGCGRALLAEGYNLYTEFGEIPPNQLLNIYKNFKDHPQFKKSAFMSSFNSYLVKMDEQIIFDENSDTIDKIFKMSIKEYENKEKKAITEAS